MPECPRELHSATREKAWINLGSLSLLVRATPGPVHEEKLRQQRAGPAQGGPQLRRSPAQGRRPRSGRAPLRACSGEALLRGGPARGGPSWEEALLREEACSGGAPALREEALLREEPAPCNWRKN